MSSVEEPHKPDTPKKQRNKKDKQDPARFHGNGVNFKAKLIGIEEVAEPRGDKMCQEAMATLKSVVKAAGEHKQKVQVNVSLDGLKILDEKGSAFHHHAVHRISFIARDVSDARAFGYIYSPGDGKHKFFGIKTEKAAENLVLTLRDLFQVVFEMKKREVDEAKRNKEALDNQENSVREDISDRTSLDSRNSSCSEGTSKSPKPRPNLLNLQSELEHLEKGLQQMCMFGQSWDVAPPASPGGWSVGSDSWGTPATPHSMGQPSMASSHSLSAQSQPPHQQTVVTAGGGFPTIPRLAHQTSAAIVPTISGPSAIQRPKSIQRQASLTKPATVKPPTWATFESPSPVEPPTDADVNLNVQFQHSPQIRSKLEAKFESDESNKTETDSESKQISFPITADPFGDSFFSSSRTECVSSENTPTKKITAVESKVIEDKYSVFSNMSAVSYEIDQVATSKNPFTEGNFTDSVAMTSTVITTTDSHLVTNETAFSSMPILSCENSENDLFKDFISDDFANKRDKLENSPQKPSVLDIKPDMALLTAPLDPFGAVSPATEAKLNTSIANVDDPFDTSSILLQKPHGPYDMSQLKPISLDACGIDIVTDITIESILGADDHESSPELQFPSPTVPPPPLPVTVGIPKSWSFFDDVPEPSTRPEHDPAILLMKQPVVGAGSIKPPPIPKRPPIVTNNSPKLVRQTTIQFPVQPVMPPPPPPRPGMNGKEIPKLSVIGRSESLGMKSTNVAPPPPPPRPSTDREIIRSNSQQSNKSERTSISPIPRPRPRPRAKTPANTVSGFAVSSNIFDAERPSSATEFRQRIPDSSFGKGKVEAFPVSFNTNNINGNAENTITTTTNDRVNTPVIVEVIVDPFADVDPFSEDKGDPFSDMPDPFTMESPMDPFSENFKGELFTTKAVTISEQPLEDDLFKDDPFTKDPFNTSNIETKTTDYSTSRDLFGDITLRTDSSLEASVSLPFAYSNDSSSAMSGDDSSIRPSRSSSTPNNSDSQKKSDPFEFDVFSNDFFKKQFTNKNSTPHTKVNSSWACLGESTDSVTPKAMDGDIQNSFDHVSPGVTPSGAPSSNHKDGDSSSSSEIADAFGDDGMPGNSPHILTQTVYGQPQSSSEC